MVQTATTARQWVTDQENSRNATVKRIRAALKKRSGKAWSVTGGRGTAWGWIEIRSTPKRRTEFGAMTTPDAAELAQLLGYSNRAYIDNHSENIPAGHDYYAEYIDRAEGRTPTTYGQQYWD